MLRYYWLVLCKAFRPSWAVADTIGTVLGLLIPAIVKLVPEDRRETVAELVWEVPLSVLLTLFIVRVVMAPWLIHREQESKLTDAQKNLTDKANELAERDRTIEVERAEHREKLYRSQTANPQTNAIRVEIERFIRLFEEMKSRASQSAIPACELYPLESRADSYLKKGDSPNTNTSLTITRLSLGMEVRIGFLPMWQPSVARRV